MPLGGERLFSTHTNPCATARSHCQRNYSFGWWLMNFQINGTLYHHPLCYTIYQYTVYGTMQTISELTISLSSVELAISKLMLGERVVRVSNGDRMVEYGQSNLIELQAYKSSLTTSLNLLNRKPRYCRISTSKGV